MVFLWFLPLSLYSLLLCTQFSFTVTNCFPHAQLANAKCHEDEYAALLEFKASFVISKSASLNPLSYPKMESWMENTDCCSWHGVECDERTGYVIGLDIRSSQLQGSLNPNSTLFHLMKLQSLSLSDNNLSYSQIPSRLGDLSSLKYLNLSRSKFSGEIPTEFSKLSNLLSLDLSSNYMPSFPFNRLRLKRDNLRSMIQNLTSLETLMLEQVDISSPIPDIFKNLTSLKKLSLSNCELFDEFPTGIFHLPNLRYLDLRTNRDLIGYLPEFYSNCLIEILRLDYTSFYGTLPNSIGNLKSLRVLLLGHCKFSGSIPSTLGNLTQLTVLELSFNNFMGYIPSSLSNLSQLYYLSVGYNEINGVTTSWIGKLTRLEVLNLAYCNLSGDIPSWILNKTNLFYLELRGNKLRGKIPPSLFSLENLSILDLCFNFLGGYLDLGKFLKLKKLTYLCLSGINLSMHTKGSSFSETLPKFRFLYLVSCNLSEFPPFLQDQNGLEGLSLSNNRINGSLPSWLWTMKNLWLLDVSKNLLIGEISQLICNLKSLEILKMSFNNLSGIIPPCLGSFSYFLKFLTLQNNKLSGLIPQVYLPGSSVQVIDFSQNNLQGQLPRALVNCKMLIFFDVSNNQINDSFPSWLGSSLPLLKVLSLRSNKFYGTIRDMRNCTFPELHIIDLSHNDFSGSFPWDVTWRWKSMRSSDMDQLHYEQTYHYFKTSGTYTPINFSYSLTIFSKGNMMVYERLEKVYYFIAIDISNNKIDGEISHTIGDLKGLVLLNLSNNMLTGAIPSSLGGLSQLEALDLSHNNLSGRIPQQLAQLTFLEVFDVSYNHLTGPIPQTKQFDTFQSSSFEGNQGLCGYPLLKEYESPLSPPSGSDDDDQPRSLFDFGWKVVLVGYGCGLLVGIIIGSTLSLEKHGWLSRIYRF